VAKKRTEILKHSALNLNRELSEEWNELRIKARTEARPKRPAAAASQPSNGRSDLAVLVSTNERSRQATAFAGNLRWHRSPFLP